MERLTQQEEEAMQLIWQNNGGFIKELLQHMEGERVPYTTLASTVKNLERKGYVRAVRYANAYRYEPLVTEEAYKESLANGLVQGYFGSSYKALVSFFAKEEKISAKELEEIIHTIQKTQNR